MSDPLPPIPPVPSGPPPPPAAEPRPSEVGAYDKHPCPACGGELRWDALKEVLRCPYCGAEQKVARPPGDTVVQEHALDPVLAATGTDAPGAASGRTAVQCQSCKAISQFDATRVAQRCEFCGSASIVPYATTAHVIHPESLLPFAFSESQVREAIRGWYGSRWFAPNRLKKAALTDRVGGVYLPYWTFDALGYGRWHADSGRYYYETETVERNGRRETREVRHTEWTPADGEVSQAFDDVLVSATRGVNADLLQGIEPFPVDSLKSYDRAYVSGWVVEQYQVDVAAAFDIAQKVMDKKLWALSAEDVPGDTHRNLQVQTTYLNRTYKHILLPVWVLHYDYGRTSYQVVVNGVTGAIDGEQPYSWVKILFALLALIVAVLVAISLYD